MECVRCSTRASALLADKKRFAPVSELPKAVWSIEVKKGSISYGRIPLHHAA
jgi:hypothetical protein